MQNLDYDGREILARAVAHYRATILAIKNRQIIGKFLRHRSLKFKMYLKPIFGCVVGSIERYPWMATPLPTHSPRPVEICKEFMSKLAPKSGYKSVGIKSRDFNLNPWSSLPSIYDKISP